MRGALTLSHPAPAGEARAAQCRGMARLGRAGCGAEGGRGVRGCQRARAVPRAFPPPSHPQPGAQTPRRAHVVRPRLLERAARAASGARGGEVWCLYVSLPHFLSSASRCLEVGAGL